MSISSFSKIAFTFTTTLLVLLVFTMMDVVQAQIPQLINYQGRVVVGAADFTGAGQFAFALVNTDGSTTYWSNDGTSSAGSQPTTAVSIAVSKGLYSVMLGDATITHMTAVPASVFANSDVRLRVWFNDGTHGFQKLAPDQRIAAVGYAMVAGSVASGAIGSDQLASDLSLNGNVTLANGDLSLPNTTDNTAGVINLGGLPFLHGFGFNNTFLGLGAGNFTMTGSYNTVEGRNSLSSNTSGIDNSALGYSALNANTTGSYNTAFGYAALTANTTGIYNTASGFNSMISNTTGEVNTADGVQTLYYNTTGSYNTAMGDSALCYNTTGMDNSAVGDQALFRNVGGSENVAFGSYSLTTNTSGTRDCAAGYDALFSNTSGVDDIAVGYETLYHNTTGQLNVAIGSEALVSATNSQNVAVGAGAGDQLTTGFGNVLIGAYAGDGLTSGNNNIEIGNTVTGSDLDTNTIRIGQPVSQNTAYIAGIYGTVPYASSLPVYINSDGELGTPTSSERFKDNIASMGDVSAAILALRPVTFHYKAALDPTVTPQFGLIAEEVVKVDPDLVVRNREGKLMGVRYDAVNAMLLNEFQKEHQLIEKQQKEIEALMVEVAALKHQDTSATANH